MTIVTAERIIWERTYLLPVPVGRSTCLGDAHAETVNAAKVGLVVKEECIWLATITFRSSSKFLK